jgi:TonB family protein
MLRLLQAGVILATAVGSAGGQSAPEPGKPVRIGPGVTPPRIVHKVEPEYSPLARADRVQGTAVFGLVVNERGLPEDIQVISPLGFGLDEKAEEALNKWRFAPGTKDGKPVPVIAQVQVNFRFPRIWFDAKAEQRRTSFNLALKNLDGTSADVKSNAVKTIQDLAQEKFAPATYLVGLWEMNGDNNVIKDTSEGWMLIQKAADQNFGPALYEVAIRSIRSGASPGDTEKHLQTLRDAAVLGSIQAQYYLGQAYEGGIAVPQEPDRARRYFRLCAIKGEPLCQYRLGRLLLQKPERSDDDYVQGLAWLQLAADQKIGEARAIVDRERPRLSSAQESLITVWKKQLSAN